jgi:hypothetical protein
MLNSIPFKFGKLVLIHLNPKGLVMNINDEPNESIWAIFLRTL